MEVAKQLGALMYYQNPKQNKEKDRDLQFEELDTGKQKWYTTRASSFLELMGKLDLSPQPIKDPNIEHEKRIKNVENCEVFIRGFWKKLKHPKEELAKVYNFFPFEELAKQLVG